MPNKLSHVANLPKTSLPVILFLGAASIVNAEGLKMDLDIATVSNTPLRILSISDFGALGDGKTDDGPAFVKAMAALTALEEAAVLWLTGPRLRISTFDKCR